MFDMREFTNRIPSVYPTLISVFKQRKGFILVQDPSFPLGISIAHGAQDNLGDLET